MIRLEKRFDACKPTGSLLFWRSGAIKSGPKCSLERPAAASSWSKGFEDMRFVSGPSLGPLVEQGQAHGGGGDGADAQRFPTGQLRFRLAAPRQRRAGPLASLSKTALDGSAAQNGLLLLPVTTRRGGQLRQYAWDGSRIKPVNTDLLGERYTPAARLLDHLAGLRRGVAASFLPNRDDVTDDYWAWLRWRLGQRFCSAVVLNFATQSLLTAVGVGAQKALAASAAINWMLKDGISRLVRMSVATQWGDAFDSDLKRFRYGSSLAFSALLTCEFVAPFLPGSFLLLASISNIGRAIGLTTFVSTQPAFQQALCASGKMADLASKTQASHYFLRVSQGGCNRVHRRTPARPADRHNCWRAPLMAPDIYNISNIPYTISARRRLLPLAAFPLFTLGDLACIYMELKAVQLRTLNRERAEMVAQGWLERGKAPTFAEVSADEGLFLPPRICGNLLPLRLLPLEQVAASPDQLRGLIKESRGDGYMLAVRPPEVLAPPAAAADWLWARCRSVLHITVALEEGAPPRVACTAVLHAAYLRRRVLDALERRAALPPPPPPPPAHDGGDGRGGGGGGRAARARQRAAAAAVGGLPVEELERCAAEARALARRHGRRFFEDITAAGWGTRRMLLSPVEAAGYQLQ
ncbi:MAG: vitamin B6 photo-protection and homoeostasis-domain-containing protein [Monoraphidium minutum]|nr:MAG: vitamin B6 photo-protection and homoeostasis-domain-containing protein [Monoraphidium minutum]